MFLIEIMLITVNFHIYNLSGNSIPLKFYSQREKSSEGNKNVFFVASIIDCRNSTDAICLCKNLTEFLLGHTSGFIGPISIALKDILDIGAEYLLTKMPSELLQQFFKI